MSARQRLVDAALESRDQHIAAVWRRFKVPATEMPTLLLVRASMRVMATPYAINQFQKLRSKIDMADYEALIKVRASKARRKNAYEKRD